MASQEQKHGNEHASSKQQSPKPSTENLDILTQQQPPLAAIIQRARHSPGSLTPRDALQLQSIIGNRAAQQLLAGKIGKPSAAKTTSRLSIQAKLTMGPEGDTYEQEADRVARHIVNSTSAGSTPITTQRQNEAEVSRQPSLQAIESEGGNIDPNLASAIQAARSEGKALSGEVRQPMEQAFGADFSGVKVHTDSQANRLNQALQAQAFTTGQDIFFRQGEYSPAASPGQELLAHELTHVVQQNSGIMQRQPPTDEQEVSTADQTTAAQPHSTPIPISSLQAPSIQCVRRLAFAGIMLWVDLYKDQNNVNNSSEVGDVFITDEVSLAKVEVLDETNNPILKVKYEGQEYWLKLPDGVKIVDEEAKIGENFDLSQLDEFSNIDFGFGDSSTAGFEPGTDFDLSELHALLDMTEDSGNLPKKELKSNTDFDLSQLDEFSNTTGGFGNLPKKELKSETDFDLSQLGAFEHNNFDFSNLLASELELVTAKASNFQVGGKNPTETYNDIVLLISFERNSNQIETPDILAISQFIANKDAIEIRSFTSEEEDPAVATSRLEAVKKYISPQKISQEKPLPMVGQGVIDYRSMRMVELVIPGKSRFDFKQGEKAPMEQEPSPEISETYGKAKTAANKMLLEIQGNLQTLDDKTLTIMKEYFGNEIQPGEMVINLERIASHMQDIGFTCMTSENPHSSSIAYNDQKEQPKIWLTPKLGDYAPEQVALVLIHEVAHSTPDLMTDDLAYGFERIIKILPPDQAIKNSDSYALFARALSAKEIKYGAIPPTDKYDQQLDQDAVKLFKESMAKIHRKVIQTGSILSAIYIRISQTAHKKLGKIEANTIEPQVYADDIYWLNQIHEKVFGAKAAKTFQFTVPYDDTHFYPPQISDAEKLAAIHDRLEKMRFALDNKDGITFSLDPNDQGFEAKWEQGPGNNVTVGPMSYFQGGEQALTKSLLKATEGISNDDKIVDAYIALLKNAPQSGL